MPDGDLSARRLGLVAIVAGLTLLAGLGVARLTYHEAIVAETAREMLGSGDFLVPKIDGRPWLEKPPLPAWLMAVSARICGSLTPTSARLPGALAAIAVCLGVTTLATRRFGGQICLFAGLIQATSAWTVTRGRLAEADIMLAAVIVLAIAAFDRIRSGSTAARWVFFLAFGGSALAKGIGFGAALIGVTAVSVLIWDRDRATFFRLIFPSGILAAGLIALAWPLLVLARYPEVLKLWTLHVSDRFAAHPTQFAGESWAEYGFAPLVQTLPWTPFALLGMVTSARRAIRERNGPDRLLWAWAVVPTFLVSAASVRNSHYLIHALPPWSIWSAIGLAESAGWLRGKGVSPARLRRLSLMLFGGAAAAWAAGYCLIGTRLNARDAEFAFYERSSRLASRSEPLVLVYDLERDDRWDKAPYPTPFGPVPADLPARLLAFDRPLTWRLGLDSLRADHPSAPFSALARTRDLDALSRLGRVEILSRGPSNRWDRSFVLVRVDPFAESPRMARDRPTVAASTLR